MAGSLRLEIDKYWGLILADILSNNDNIDKPE